MNNAEVRPTVTVAALVALLKDADQLKDVLGSDLNAPVGGCSFDSRSVAAGDLFFCKGAAFRPAFLSMALEAGCAAYVCEETLAEELARVAESSKAVGLVVKSVRTAMALLPPAVYAHPDKAFPVVGITGTKGKTTTAFMVQSIIKAADETCGMMGSVTTDDGIECFESTNTTPEAPEVWRHLANCQTSARDAMVMEVSSQALKYQRVENLTFDTACFLNIGRDHISPVEHPSYEDYFESKLKIFDQCRCAVINLGSDDVDRVREAADKAERVMTVGVEHPEADIWASDVTPVGFKVRFTLHGVPEAEGRNMTLGIAGDFNVENALVAIAVARELKLPFTAIEHGLAHLRVPGRMEVVESADGRVIAMVDYAHNQLSFRSLYASVERAFPKSKVISLFGAPGGKAHERREQLPREAAPHSDLLIFCNEDPAHDDPLQICEDLAGHVPDATPYEIILDRTEAVRRAFEHARSIENDGSPVIVLLLAKGDEELMHIGDEFVPIESDLHLAQRFIDRADVAES